MIINKRSADSYIGTFFNTPEDNELLDLIRGLVSKINKASNKKFYLKKHGRGSRTSEAVKAYYKEKYPTTHQYLRPEMELPLQFADHYDLYIYDRYPYFS